MPWRNGVANTDRNNRRRGSSMIEFCLLLPWYIFLFVGAYDFGFYAYSLIATTNAARVSAAYCSKSNSTCSSDTASPNFQSNCTNYVIGQLKWLPNIGSAVTACTGSPLTLTVSYPTICPESATAADCVTVTVAYVTPQLIPIPGVLPGQVTITKAVTMRLLS